MVNGSNALITSVEIFCEMPKGGHDFLHVALDHTPHYYHGIIRTLYGRQVLNSGIAYNGLSERVYNAILAPISARPSFMRSFPSVCASLRQQL